MYSLEGWWRRCGNSFGGDCYGYWRVEKWSGWFVVLFNSIVISLWYVDVGCY